MLNNKRVLPMIGFVLLMAAIACTCGPITQLTSVASTAQSVSGTVVSAATEYGPTIEAGLTQMGPTLQAGATELAAQATLLGPELQATLTAVVATAAAQGGFAPSGNTLRQWGFTATASSQYSTPEWSAMQAVGPKDTFECGDISTAWASGATSGIEWLRVSYPIAVVPSEIAIYESYNPGAVVQVEVVDLNGQTHTVYTGQPAQTNECPRVMTIPLANIDFAVNSVVIYVDMTTYNNWSQIDAVEMVGRTP